MRDQRALCDSHRGLLGAAGSLPRPRSSSAAEGSRPLGSAPCHGIAVTERHRGSAPRVRHGCAVGRASLVGTRGSRVMAVRAGARPRGPRPAGPLPCSRWPCGLEDACRRRDALVLRPRVGELRCGIGHEGGLERWPHFESPGGDLGVSRAVEL